MDNQNNFENHLIGYLENDEFWCAQEVSSLETAHDLIHELKRIYKRDYIIINKTIKYEQFKNQ